MHTQVRATTSDGRGEPWNGEFYVSFGHGEARSWSDAVEYGFICGGGKPWYSRTLHLLGEGDRVWVNIPGLGYVAVGRVTGPAVRARDFTVSSEGASIPVLQVAQSGSYHRDRQDDPERCEYFVAVQWLQTVPVEQAFREVGLFGNQNTVCKPTAPKWRFTVDRLKKRFPDFEQ